MQSSCVHLIQRAEVLRKNSENRNLWLSVHWLLIFFMQTLQVARSLCYYLVLSLRKMVHTLLGNICRRFLLWDSLPGSSCEDVFVFCVGNKETTAGCALSAVPFPSLFCV